MFQSSFTASPAGVGDGCHGRTILRCLHERLPFTPHTHIEFGHQLRFTDHLSLVQDDTKASEVTARTVSTLFVPLPHHWFWFFAKFLPTQLAQFVGKVPSKTDGLASDKLFKCITLEPQLASSNSWVTERDLLLRIIGTLGITVNVPQ